MFGFLINLPVVSYYEAGTNLTANHGHGALMGVFGFLAVALLVVGLRQASDTETWRRVEKYVRLAFWGLNTGLALMIVLNLFPSGVLQLFDVMEHGYWHGRSEGFVGSLVMVRLGWWRLPADLIFIFLGVVPLVLATVMVFLRAPRVPHRPAPPASAAPM